MMNVIDHDKKLSANNGFFVALAVPMQQAAL